MTNTIPITEIIILANYTNTKLISLNSAISRIWLSQNIKPLLTKDIEDKIRLFFIDSSFLADEITLLTENTQLFDEIATKNILTDLAQLTKSVKIILKEVEALLPKKN